MPFDIKKMSQPATKGDVAGVSIDSLVALGQVNAMLVALAGDRVLEFQEELKAINEAHDSLLKRFHELSGWVDDGS